MTAKDLAEKINNVEYPVRIDPELNKLAKINGLVIVYGASDDLMEFDGAISDEVGCCGGGTTLIDREGLLPDRESLDDDEELEDFFQRKNSARVIEALWCKEEGVSWTYKTDIPHATFDVKEDGETYCKGIVFSLNDVGIIPLDLKCTVTITGKQGGDEANINIEFDPPILKEGENLWGDCGASTIVSMVMDALRKAKSGE